MQRCCEMIIDLDRFWSSSYFPLRYSEDNSSHRVWNGRIAPGSSLSPSPPLWDSLLPGHFRNPKAFQSLGVPFCCQDDVLWYSHQLSTKVSASVTYQSRMLRHRVLFWRIPVAAWTEPQMRGIPRCFELCVGGPDKLVAAVQQLMPDFGVASLTVSSGSTDRAAGNADSTARSVQRTKLHGVRATVPHCVTVAPQNSL